MDEPDWGGYALNSSDAKRLCASKRDLARVWVQRRWRRLFQSPPAFACVSANDSTTRLVSLNNGVWIDRPIPQVRATHTVDTSPFADPSLIIETLSDIDSSRISAHVLQEVRELEHITALKTTTERFRYTFLHVDASVTDLYGIKRSMVVADEKEIRDRLPDLISEINVNASNMRGARLKVGECGQMLCVAPSCGQLIHEIVGHAFESLAPGNTIPWVTVGQRVSDSGITVYDDPGLPGGFANRTMDDAGNTARETLLIDKGVVADGFTSGGCWIRGAPNSPLKIRVTNLVLSGNTPQKDMVREAWNGVYISHIGKASFDPRNGMFEILVTEALRISRGQADEPVRPFRIYTSAKLALERIVGVGGASADDKFYCVTRYGPTRSSVRQPSLLFQDLATLGVDDECN